MPVRIDLWFLLLLLSHLYLCLAQHCDLDFIRIPGDIVLSTIAGIRDSHDGLCGKYIPGELQTVAAMVWSVEKLNGSPTGNSYIPGKTIGIDISDDCNLERKAVKITIDTLIRAGYDDVGSCSTAKQAYENSTVVGIIDTSTSQTVKEVAKLAQGSHLPVISSAATAAGLGNNTLYPSFYRTVPSDTEQTKVLLETVKQLNWTYIAVVYTTDAYGMDGVHLLRKLTAVEEKVCIITEKSISPHERHPETAEGIITSLASKLGKTRHNQLGIVYIGQLAQASLLLRAQQDGARKYDRDFKRLFWVMSEAIGLNENLIPKSSQQVDGLITVALPSTVLKEFKTYFLDHLENVIQGKSDHPLSRLFKKYVETSYNCEFDNPLNSCARIQRSFLEKNYQQSDYVASAIDAVYVLVTALKNDPSSCTGDPMCVPPSFKYTRLVRSLNETTLDYSKIEENFAPYEFRLLKRVIKFDAAGELMTNDKTVSYEVYNVWKNKHSIVGSYTNNTLTLDKNKINVRDPESGLNLSGQNLPRSTCGSSCQECIPVEDIQFSYIPGDLLLLGLFSLSEKSDGDFECREFRSNTVSYLTFEAFEYAISVIQRKYPMLKFGGIAFDDCYNPLRAEYILSNFLSGKYKLFDQRTNTYIDPDKVILVIGSLSSDVTLEVADMLRRIRIPQISYGASSTDLDDREKYAYFLRTVPSDKTQVNAIVDLLDAMNWKYVAVMYMDNNYGTEGMKTFKKYANKRGICLADTVPISKSVIEKSFKDIVSTLRRTYAKVIVYFGIDTLAEKVLDSLRDRADVDPGEFLFVATEAWGVNEALLKEGRVNYARGSVVLHSDTTLYDNTDQFKVFVSQKDPFTCTKCDWLRLFWQDRFSCKFEDGFIANKRDLPLCNRINHGRFNASDLNKYSRDQRVVHTINAVLAGAKGIEKVFRKLCRGEICSPSSVSERTMNGAKLLTNAISQVTLSSQEDEKLFDENGNGLIGFTIFNIQYSTSKSGYGYIDVGKYENGKFVLYKDKLAFYDIYGSRQSSVKSECVLKNQCSECENQTRPPTEYTTTMSENTTLSSTSENLEGALIGVSVLACLETILLAVLVILCCVCKNRKQQPKERQGEQSRYHGDGQVNTGFALSETATINHPVLESNDYHQDVDDPLYHEISHGNPMNTVLQVSTWLENSKTLSASANSSNSHPLAANSSGFSRQTCGDLVPTCMCSNPSLKCLETECGYLLMCVKCQRISSARLSQGAVSSV
ncbi:uncharacterized protein LOC135470406 [Liolophura sinensis]|uniref:uncharacterized protein LOC135470406 n=1 Tax=Liolophura sinensis TaxID=3198878 RepID=UPI00315969AD